MRIYLSCVLAAALSFNAAHAQNQPPRREAIPPAALGGVASPGVTPALQINGKAARLAPGGRIIGANNMLVLSSALPDNSPVAMTLENNGDIKTMWVLTEQEQKVKRNKY
jgi:hypothetical protein